MILNLREEASSNVSGASVGSERILSRFTSAIDFTNNAVSYTDDNSAQITSNTVASMEQQ